MSALAGELHRSVDDFLGNDDDFAVGALAVGADPVEGFGGVEAGSSHDDALSLLDYGPAEGGRGDGFVGEPVRVGVNWVRSTTSAHTPIGFCSSSRMRSAEMRSLRVPPVRLRRDA